MRRTCGKWPGGCVDGDAAVLVAVDVAVDATVVASADADDVEVVVVRLCIRCSIPTLPPVAQDP